ncbi:MAG: M23 family metallopeptidase [Clostridiales bacterium]|nr:M23 family metallopeptidase [Clostridiales bacterium]
MAGFDSDFGNFVKVHHGDGFYSQYMHLDSRMFTVSASDPPVPIGKRQMLGVSGNTGDSEGYHLHFEIFFDDNRAKAVNPLTSYHSGDTRSGWTNPNPLFILSDGQYVFDSGFDRAYTSNEYTSHSTAYRR